MLNCIWVSEGAVCIQGFSPSLAWAIIKIKERKRKKATVSSGRTAFQTSKGGNTRQTLPWLAALMPRWVRLVVRLPVLLDELSRGKATVSSGSSGVDSGGGNWMLVRSGSEPPVLCAAGSTDGFSSWSGDGNILRGNNLYIRRCTQ